MQVNKEQLKYVFKKLEPKYNNVTNKSLSLRRMASILEKNHPQSTVRATIQAMSNVKGIETPEYIALTDKELKEKYNN